MKPFSALYIEYIGAENHLFRACCNALQPMVGTMRHAGLLTHRQPVIRSTFKYHASCRARAGISIHITLQVTYIHSNICNWFVFSCSGWFIYNPLYVVNNTQWLRFHTMSAFQAILIELKFQKGIRITVPEAVYFTFDEFAYESHQSLA
jgi:hypothetical protein